MAAEKNYEILSQVNLPDDLKKLPPDKLPLLCNELRQYIIDAATTNPGHLGANLGVVELTVALHRVFNAPEDKIIFDVGHQAYSHKILTGRRDRFDTNRKYNGISGFPCIEESEYDAFGTGHASTSISAALGMATAAELSGDKNCHVVAVIGDASLCGGMAFEALNNAGAARANMLVILNDNRMAIDPAVGAVSEYLLHITTSAAYNRFKENAWNFLGNNFIRRMIQRFQRSMKTALLHQNNLFEAFNFRYFGPVDGHDVLQLVKVLGNLYRIPGPKLLHVRTVKGKGYPYAEQDQVKWHAPGAFDKPSGTFLKKEKELSYSDVFGQTLVELAAQDKRIVAVTPAMALGSGLYCMQQKFPERTFDVGIAEEHAVTFSAGLAVKGMLPFCCLYSTFLQRAFDQIIHDVALQNLHVVFMVDRAGLVGRDGATHQGVFDMAALRCVPNLVIASPATEQDLRNLIYTASRTSGPFLIRYPRQKAAAGGWDGPFTEMEIGRGRVLREGRSAAILSMGPLCSEALRAAEMFPEGDIGVYDMRFLKPLDESLLNDVLARYPLLVTIDDGVATGGLGSAVVEYAARCDARVHVERLGVPDYFVRQGTREELLRECGCDADGIARALRKYLPAS